MWALYFHASNQSHDYEKITIFIARKKERFNEHIYLYLEIEIAKLFILMTVVSIALNFFFRLFHLYSGSRA